MRRSIRIRLIVWTLALLLPLCAGAGWLLIQVFGNRLLHDIDVAVQEEAETVGELLAAPTSPDAVTNLLAQHRQGDGLGAAQVRHRHTGRTADCRGTARRPRGAASGQAVTAHRTIPVSQQCSRRFDWRLGRCSNARPAAAALAVGDRHTNDPAAGCDELVGGHRPRLATVGECVTPTGADRGGDAVGAHSGREPGRRGRTDGDRAQPDARPLGARGGGAASLYGRCGA